MSTTLCCVGGDVWCGVGGDVWCGVGGDVWCGVGGDVCPISCRKHRCSLRQSLNHGQQLVQWREL